MQHKLQIELINDTINIFYISLLRRKELQAPIFSGA